MSTLPALPAGPPVKQDDKKTTATKPVGPKRQGRFDHKFFCTCPTEKIEKFKNLEDQEHPKTCPVWLYDDWKSRRCEWDPKKKAWFYTCHCEPMATGLECKLCGVKKYYEKGPWVPNDNDNYGTTSWQGASYGGGYGGGGGYVQKCRHMEQEVIFPGEIRVFASSEMSHEPPKGIPDFALYAYDGWRPRSLATIIPWKDYGLPTCPWPVAAGAIKEAHGLAKEGWSIEVGCAGGHGRTGTILACMAVLSGIPAINAVAWVHEHYCDHAVEGELQEWWVLWFECWHLGIPTPHTLPEKPKPESIKVVNVKKSTAPKMLTKEAKKVVADALADGSPRTMEQYAEYLKTAPDEDDSDVGWDDLIGDEEDAAAYLAWQARCAEANDLVVEPALIQWSDVPEDVDPANWQSVDPEVEDRWDRTWDLIEGSLWPAGETDEEFWERVNNTYDDLCEQDENGEAAPEGLDTDDEPIEVSGLGKFRSFFGLD